jgi:hypothetical protein
MHAWSAETQHLAAASRLLAAGAGLTLLLYWGHVCPVLYRHGARFPTGLALYRFARDLRRYQALRRADGQPANLYYTLLVLTWFTAGALLAAAGIWLNNSWAMG